MPSLRAPPNYFIIRKQPLSRMAEREEAKRESIQSYQSGGKPLASITARKLVQLTESKAFAKSSLRTTHGARWRKQVCTNSVA